MESLGPVLFSAVTSGQTSQPGLDPLRPKPGCGRELEVRGPTQSVLARGPSLCTGGPVWWGCRQGTESSGVPKRREPALVAPRVYLPAALLQIYLLFRRWRCPVCLPFGQPLTDVGDRVRVPISSGSPSTAWAGGEVAGSCPGT